MERMDFLELGCVHRLSDWGYAHEGVLDEDTCLYNYTLLTMKSICGVEHEPACNVRLSMLPILPRKIISYLLQKGVIKCLFEQRIMGKIACVGRLVEKGFMPLYATRSLLGLTLLVWATSLVEAISSSSWTSNTLFLLFVSLATSLFVEKARMKGTPMRYVKVLDSSIKTARM